MSSAAPTPALEVRGLSKHFGGVYAVDRCSFQAPKGQVTGLIGPNGAGKSTAIDLISGFKLPDSGTVLFKGRALEGLDPHDISRLGLIRTFQSPREWPGLTVLENVVMDPDTRVLKKIYARLTPGGTSMVANGITRTITAAVKESGGISLQLRRPGDIDISRRGPGRRPHVP